MQENQYDGWDNLVKTELERFQAQYQALKVVVHNLDTAQPNVAYVHVPYMMGTVTWLEQPDLLARQRPRHQARLRRVARARQEAPPKLQAFFQRWFYAQSGKERLVAIGKSGPKEIRQLLQAAVDAGLVAADCAGLTGPSLRAWLQRYGIGVDCSGFVQHALTHLLRASYAAAGETPSSPQETEVGWMLAQTVYRKLVQNADDRRFDLVDTPALARAGNVLIGPGHSRIIVDLQHTDGQGLLVTLAESTSRTDLVGRTELQRDVGPRLYHLLYPEPEQAIKDQLPEHKRTFEAEYEFEPSESERQYLIARNRRLAAFHQAHAPSEPRAREHSISVR
jgi:hypothetical protein